MIRTDVLELATWRRIRRYAVPHRMIEECTRAREAGDWRAACAAGRVDVVLDPAALRRRFGAALVEQVEGQLRSFAPDLLRWHLPRVLGGQTTLAPGWHVVLCPPAGAAGPDTAALVVRTPVSSRGSQRITLDAVAPADLPGTAVLDLAPHLWDARSAAGLRTAVGGSATRLPRFAADGMPLPLAEWGAGDDAPARTERVFALVEAGEHVRAWREAGLELDITALGDLDAAWRWHVPYLDLLGAPTDPSAVAAEVRRLAARYGTNSWAVRFEYGARVRVDVSGATLRARLVPHDYRRRDELDGVRNLPAAAVRRSPDLELVRAGWMAPGELHPLVRAALFPEATVVPPVADSPGDVRVRCRGEWHRVDPGAGCLRALDHPPGEPPGPPDASCLAVVRAWTAPAGRLPRRLREHRNNLWLRMLHGGTRTVVELLDAGMDPQIRDARGMTLLHMLDGYDHRVLLPRLLDAGLDVNARDRQQCTALDLAVAHGWSPEVIKALVEAGAQADQPRSAT